MWNDKHSPDTIYGDQRTQIITVTDHSHGNTSGQRVLKIEPDVKMDFRHLPFPDSSFVHVVFDPPHLIRAGEHSWLSAKYGKLDPAHWKDDIRQGFAECFRVLKPDGTLVFKWNEDQVKLSEVVPLAPYPPLYGHLSGRKGLTHWLVFLCPEH